jgi:hypothetical protein
VSGSPMGAITKQIFSPSAMSVLLPNQNERRSDFSAVFYTIYKLAMPTISMAGERHAQGRGVEREAVAGLSIEGVFILDK